MAARTLACRGCRSGIVQSFAATFLDAPQIARFQPPRVLLPRCTAKFSHGRPLQAVPPAQTSSFSTTTPAADSEEASVPAPSDTDPPAPSPDPVLPWYLQVEPPEPPAPSHPFADRQLIPALPPHSPLILSPLLSYLSVDAGLDDLTLLDLRSLNPPPALGANLLMVIGTARSVKHLNVSADRFCRWLRSNYRLRPYADGLIGRNELKLKLRRKARKAKLARSVGNTMYGREGAGVDDGITTGWICVNVGQVEDGLVEDAAELDEEETQVGGIMEEVAEEEEDYTDPERSGDERDADYAGFGSRSDAPRIVVQMLIEEKRAELDLEGLWHDRSTRRTRKAGRGNEDAEAVVEEHALA